MFFRFLFFILALCPAFAQAATITIEGNSSSLGGCIPFGGGSNGSSTAPYDYELEFTVDTAFNFSGGGLIIRFEKTGDYRQDTTCSKVLVGNASSDSSAYFTAQFYDDKDGIYPWDNTAKVDIGGFRLKLSGVGRR